MGRWDREQVELKGSRGIRLETAPGTSVQDVEKVGAAQVAQGVEC